MPPPHHATIARISSIDLRAHRDNRLLNIDRCRIALDLDARLENPVSKANDQPAARIVLAQAEQVQTRPSRIKRDLCPRSHEKIPRLDEQTNNRVRDDACFSPDCVG
jgi:hypothetical protein